MRRLILALATVAVLVPGSSGIARQARSEDCNEYCGKKAAEKCEDIGSSWCSVYIVGCLAGCGMSGCPW